MTMRARMPSNFSSTAYRPGLRMAASRLPCWPASWASKVGRLMVDLLLVAPLALALTSHSLLARPKSSPFGIRFGRRQDRARHGRDEPLGPVIQRGDPAAHPVRQDVAEEVLADQDERLHVHGGDDSP